MTIVAPMQQAQDEQGDGVAVGGNGQLNRLIHEDPDAALFRVHRDAFVSQEVFEAERREVFDRCWLYVGHESEIPNPADFLTRKVGGRPLILCRDSDGGVRVHINTCTHRGAEVCREARGNSKTFKCFYHAWTYNTSGALVGIPGREAFGAGFDAEERRLQAPAGVDVYRGFVFATFNPEAESLPEYLGAAGEYIDLVADQSEAGMQVQPGTHQYSIRANWKLLVENSLDGYHLVPLHRTYFSYVRATEGEPLGKRRGTQAKDLGNGHAVILDHAPWGRPVARWAPTFGEWAREPIETRLRRLQELHGEERAQLIADTDRNLLVFPNLVINDIMGTVVRTIWPTAPDHHEVSGWALAPADMDDRLRKLTLDNFISFLGPGGFATPDDMEALESCQRGFAASREVPWSDVSRGMEKPLGEAVSSDEVQMRAFWRRWNELLGRSGSSVAEPVIR
jgi:p-cumate 2,3-dioxygenase alpha subunit